MLAGGRFLEEVLGDELDMADDVSFGGGGTRAHGNKFKNGEWEEQE